MEEKLKEILDNYEGKIDWYETQVKKIVVKMDLYKNHGFHEEFRVLNIEYQAIHQCICRWREMHKEIKDVLDAWLS